MISINLGKCGELCYFRDTDAKPSSRTIESNAEKE